MRNTSCPRVLNCKFGHESEMQNTRSKIQFFRCPTPLASTLLPPRVASPGVQHCTRVHHTSYGHSMPQQSHQMTTASCGFSATMKVWSAGSCIGVVAQVPECPRVNARYVGVGCANSGVKAEKASRCARIVTVTECYNYRMLLPRFHRHSSGLHTAVSVTF